MHQSLVPPILSILLAGLTIALAVAPTEVFLAWIGVMLAAAIGMIVKLLIGFQTSQRPDLLQLLLELARDHEIDQLHGDVAQAMRRIARRSDPIFRQHALAELQSVASHLDLLGSGVLEFVSTESWRIVYEQLLRSPGLHLYRSVAHIQSPQYWQDEPGHQSTQLNVELHDAETIRVERTAVIADRLWPADELFPREPIHSWLDEQNRYGIWLRLVRESSVESEPDLLCDYGIYGSRAVGIQTLDQTGKTVRFRLDFNLQQVQEAERKWNQLAVYAVSYSDLLDQRE